jgi:hypothetical protein
MFGYTHSPQVTRQGTHWNLQVSNEVNEVDTHPSHTLPLLLINHHTATRETFTSERPHSCPLCPVGLLVVCPVHISKDTFSCFPVLLASLLQCLTESFRIR